MVRHMYVQVVDVVGIFRYPHRPFTLYLKITRSLPFPSSHPRCVIYPLTRARHISVGWPSEENGLNKVPGTLPMKDRSPDVSRCRKEMEIDRGKIGEDQN